MSDDRPTILQPLGGPRFLALLPALDYAEVLRQRRGEVVMLIRRAPGWLLLQSKRKYPPGTFRLPTGRIEGDDTAESTMLRELFEESNLAAKHYRLLFSLEYESSGQRWGFRSEGYLIDAPGGDLRPNDPTEAICAWREAQIAELVQVARDLRQVEESWQPWGHFRSAVHDLAHQLLATSGDEG